MSVLQGPVIQAAFTGIQDGSHCWSMDPEFDYVNRVVTHSSVDLHGYDI